MAFTALRYNGLSDETQWTILIRDHYILIHILFYSILQFTGGTFHFERHVIVL